MLASHDRPIIVTPQLQAELKTQIRDVYISMARLLDVMETTPAGRQTRERKLHHAHTARFFAGMNIEPVLDIMTRNELDIMIRDIHDAIDRLDYVLNPHLHD